MPRSPDEGTSSFMYSYGARDATRRVVPERFDVDADGKTACADDECLLPVLRAGRAGGDLPE